MISDPVNDGVLNNPACDVPTQFTNNPERRNFPPSQAAAVPGSFDGKAHPT